MKLLVNGAVVLLLFGVAIGQVDRPENTPNGFEPRRVPTGAESLLTRLSCPYESKYRHEISDFPMIWREAKEYCISIGGSLAIHRVKTLEDRNLIRNDLKREDLWIGASDREREGVWMWVNGDELKLDEKIWAAGQPNNRCAEHCAMIPGFSTQNAYDVTCNQMNHALCEFETC